MSEPIVNAVIKASPLLSFILVVRGDGDRLETTIASLIVAHQSVNLKIQILMVGINLTPRGEERCCLATHRYFNTDWLQASASSEAVLLNTAITLARGQWIWFLEAGDELERDAISCWNGLRLNNPDILLFAADGQHLDGTHVPVRRHPALSPSLWAPQLACEGLYCFGAIVWCRHVINKIGELPEHLRVAYIEAWLLVFLDVYSHYCCVTNNLWVSTHYYSDWGFAGRCRQRALEMSELLAGMIGSSPAVFVHKYGLQLQRQEACCSAHRTEAEEFLDLIEQARPFLGESGFRQLSVTWGLDPSILPTQQKVNDMLGNGGISKLWSIRLLSEMVDPGLSSLQLGSTSGQYLRLAQHLLSCDFWSRYKLLRQDRSLVEMLNLHIDGIPIVGLLHWLDSDSLRRTFPLPSASESYSLWWTYSASHCCPHLEFDSFGRLLLEEADSNVSDIHHSYPFGVNLIGHAFEHFGVAEDVRMAALALHSAGVPFCVVNVPAHDQSTQTDNTLADNVLPPGEIGPYRFNLVCLTALSHAQWIAHQGINQQRGRHTLSAWPWETQSWPHQWEIALSLSNSIWCSSHFTAKAFEELGKQTALDLRIMPMAVHVQNPESYRDSAARNETRCRWGIDLGSRVILFIFDAKSVIERKNPSAAILAFQTAFPLTSSDQVELIIKALPPTSPCDEWESILNISRADWRIKIITEDLQRDELLSLVGASDVYLSLHRSEGYGRTIAEAALLGLEIVASNFGGNVDFSSGDGFYMVPCKPWPIPPGTYPEASGHMWAEPDVQIASLYLRKAVEQAPLRLSRSIASLSLEWVGRNYRFALESYSLGH